MLSWSLLDETFTAETIMTPREALLTLERDNDKAHVESEARTHSFDVVPITEDDQIVGVLKTRSGNEHSLTRQWVVSSDTTIPDLLTLFVETEHPGFLVLHGQDVVGLVTPADFNKMPARIYFYNLIGKLEIELADLIRRHFEDDREALIESLPDGSRQAVREEQKKLAEGDAEIDPIQMLYLSDLAQIVAENESLFARLGFSSKTKTNDKLGGIVSKFRNQTMHTVRPLIEENPKDLYKLHNRVQRAKKVLAHVA